MDIPYKRTKDGIVIQVRVQPRSSKREIIVENDRVRVRLKSPPVDNKANDELVELMAKELGVRKGSISIIKGFSSKEKVLLIASS